MCCSTPSTFSWAIYKSTLAPTSYLSRAWKLTRHECLGPFQVFSEHLPHPGHACVLFNFQEYVGTFQRLYSPKYLTVQFSLPGFLVCLLFAQIVISFPRWQQLINFLLNVSDKCPLGTHLSASDKFWVRRNKEGPFAPVLQGATILWGQCPFFTLWHWEPALEMQVLFRFAPELMMRKWDHEV